MSTLDPSHALDQVVLVLFENRSLDNVLGHLYGPEDGKTFEGLIGKDLSNPIPQLGRALLSTQGLSVHGRHRHGLANPNSGEEHFHTNTQLFNIVDDENRFETGEASLTGRVVRRRRSSGGLPPLPRSSGVPVAQPDQPPGQQLLVTSVVLVVDLDWLVVLGAGEDIRHCFLLIKRPREGALGMRGAHRWPPERRRPGQSTESTKRGGRSLVALPRCMTRTRRATCRPRSTGGRDATVPAAFGDRHGPPQPSTDAFSRSSADVNDVSEGSTRPGRRVVTSWTSHRLPSGSSKEQKDP